MIDINSNSSLIQGTVTGIDLNEKKIFMGHHDAPIQFTDLVIAVGSQGSMPGQTKAIMIGVSFESIINGCNSIYYRIFDAYLIKLSFSSFIKRSIA